jgi:hypothetical protein
VIICPPEGGQHSGLGGGTVRWMKREMTAGRQRNAQDHPLPFGQYQAVRAHVRRQPRSPMAQSRDGSRVPVTIQLSAFRVVMKV